MCHIVSTLHIRGLIHSECLYKLLIIFLIIHKRRVYIFKALFASAFLTLLSINTAMASGAKSCEVYKKEIDIYLSKIKEKSQLDLISKQYEQSFTQLSNLPPETQDMACKQAM